MKALKKQIKGITLVALVVTIIVLLILSGVAISFTVGEGGIFKRAQQGAEIYENASNNEKTEVDKISNFIGDYLNGNSNGDLEVIYYDKTTKIKINDNEEVTIPGGFGLSKDTANNIKDGIVIQDKKGNEYVWVPVENINDMYIEEEATLTGTSIKVNGYSNLKSSENTVGKPGEEGTLREPDILGQEDVKEEYFKEILGFNSLEEMADEIANTYESMINSIKTYGGFYIGRYELTGTIDNPTEIAGEVIENKNWYELYDACKKVVNTEYAKSTMIYDCQWDAVCDWIIKTGAKSENEVNEDSSSWGNYYNTNGGTQSSDGKPINTGSNDKYQVNKIYDLAGNYLEWTQGAITTSHDSRTRRGGNYQDNGGDSPVKARGYWHPYESKGFESTRTTLYIIK